MWICRAALALVLTLAAAAAAPALRAQEADEDAAARAEQLRADVRAAVSSGQNDKAAQLLQEILVILPDDPDSLVALGRVWSWLGRYDDSIASFDRYLATHPDDLDVVAARAQVRAWKGDFPAAEAELRAVVEKEPENIDANLALAAVLEWTGRRDEAARIYEWVLLLDPENETAGDASRAAAEAATAYTLLPQVAYSADNQEYFALSTQVGLSWHPSKVWTLTPYAAVRLLDDRRTSLMTGTGGGMEALLQAGERVRLGGEASTCYYFGDGTALDWGTRLKVDVEATSWLGFWVAADTLLWGPVAQSAGALQAGIRTWRGTASVGVVLGNFSAALDASLAALVQEGESRGLVSTDALTMRYHVAGQDPRLFLGYKAWYTGYSEAAPDRLYWSPAHYLSHQGVAQLEGAMGERGRFQLEAGGGMGQEWVTPSGQGTAAPEGDHWDWFPVASAGGELALHVSEDFDTGLSGWVAFSSHAGSTYWLWNAAWTAAMRW